MEYSINTTGAQLLNEMDEASLVIAGLEARVKALKEGRADMIRRLFEEGIDGPRPKSVRTDTATYTEKLVIVFDPEDVRRVFPKDYASLKDAELRSRMEEIKAIRSDEITIKVRTEDVKRLIDALPETRRAGALDLLGRTEKREYAVSSVRRT